MNHFFHRLRQGAWPVQLSGWFIPLVALLVAAFLVAAFAYNFRGRSGEHNMPEPARRLTVSEPFSGHIYFNTEFGQTDFSQTLIGAIDDAHQRIDVAVYSLDHPGIRDALYRAARRGVTVTLILSDKHGAGQDAVLKDMPSGMTRHDIATGSGNSGSMHDKFMIVDSGLPQAKLFFGSYNFTVLQEKFDPSFLLETDRSEIIAVFAEEFDHLKNGLNGAAKTRAGVNPFAARITYPEGYLEIWFGPQEGNSGMRERLLGLIKNAKQNLSIMIWNLTDAGVAEAIGDRAGVGLPINLLTDDTNVFGPDSALPDLLARQKTEKLASLEILTDAKRNAEIKNVFKQNDLNSFLHLHVLIADNQTVLFGTGNWSRSGFYSNDESAMVSDIPFLVAAFQETQRLNASKAR